MIVGDRGLLDDDDLRRWLRERGVELHAPAQLLSALD
jgi:hypothetical protein